MRKSGERSAALPSDCEETLQHGNTERGEGGGGDSESGKAQRQLMRKNEVASNRHYH